MLGTGKVLEELKILKEVIINKIESTYNMLNNILSTERIAHGSYPLKKENLDMYLDVIEPVLEHVELSEKMTKKRVIIDYKSSMGPEEAILFADKEYCRILYRNIFDNALKHIKAKGRMSYGVESSGDYYIFNVYNEGDAIPPDMIHQIFDKWKTGEKYGGVGLGLYLSRLIVEKHGGAIFAEKGRRDGANIMFTLPKAEKLEAKEKNNLEEQIK